MGGREAETEREHEIGRGVWSKGPERLAKEEEMERETWSTYIVGITVWVLKEQKTKGACLGLVHSSLWAYVHNLDDSSQLTVLVPSLDTASHAGQVSRSDPRPDNTQWQTLEMGYLHLIPVLKA